MTKKIMIIIGLLVAFTATVIAAPNLEKPKGPSKLMKIAGEKSPYYRMQKESFPKDYFLVNQNLPFLVGISLFHPNSDSLKLDKEQLASIIKSKDSTVHLSCS